MKKKASEKERTRLRLLYVQKILEENTDENPEHSIGTQEIIDALKKYDIPDKADAKRKVDRRTVSEDIKALNRFYNEDYDPEAPEKNANKEDWNKIRVENKEMEKYKTITTSAAGCKTKYYFKTKDIELHDLKLIVDAVQSARIIPEEKANELRDKLRKLTSKKNEEVLDRTVSTMNRVRNEREAALATLDIIHDAIKKKRQISFLYLDWVFDSWGGEEKLKLIPRRNGKIYEISPWKVVWDNQNYYMMGYDEEAAAMKTYRVDKMDDVQILKEKSRTGEQNEKNYDFENISKVAFGMFGGTKKDAVRVQMRIHKSLLGVMVERFGKEGGENGLTILEEHPPSDHLIAVHNIIVSPQFFGWLAGLGSKITIVSPPKVAQKYTDYLKELYELQHEMLNK